MRANRLAGVVLALVVLEFANSVSADEALQKKCTRMTQIAQQIAIDRDRGVPYKTRQERNRAVADDMPTIETWLHSVTKAIYFDLSNLSPHDIAMAEAQACINNG